MVALTFDDGPVPGHTGQILDILAAHQARATFFVLGHLAQRQPGLVRRAAREGHEIGIHSWDHDDFTRLSGAQIVQDIQRCEGILKPLTEGDRPMRWFRPPYGARNARVEAAVQKAGYSIAMWSVDTRDWRRPGSDAIYRRVLERVHDGAVLLLHDGGGPREGTVEAVRRLVPALVQRGYKLVTLSELKGLALASPGEVGVTSAAGTIPLARVAELTVVIDGQEVDLPTAALEVAGQLLLPAEPALPRLGASYHWDKDQQTVHISGLRGNLLLRLDSLEAERDGQPIKLRVPLLVYQDMPMIPLWALVNITGAQARHDSRRAVLSLTSSRGRRPISVSAWIGPSPRIRRWSGAPSTEIHTFPPGLKVCYTNR